MKWKDEHVVSMFYMFICLYFYVSIYVYFIMFLLEAVVRCFECGTVVLLNGFIDVSGITMIPTSQMAPERARKPRPHRSSHWRRARQ